MSDPVYLLHLVMGAVIGGIGLACTISIQREAKADVQRLLDGLDAAVDSINTYADACNENQLITNRALAASMENSIARSQACIEKAVFLQGTHTDNTIQRVLTRPEARITVECPDGHAASRGGML